MVMIIRVKKVSLMKQYLTIIVKIGPVDKKCIVDEISLMKHAE